MFCRLFIVLALVLLGCLASKSYDEEEMKESLKALEATVADLKVERMIQEEKMLSMKENILQDITKELHEREKKVANEIYQNIENRIHNFSVMTDDLAALTQTLSADVKVFYRFYIWVEFDMMGYIHKLVIFS